MTPFKFNSLLRSLVLLTAVYPLDAGITVTLSGDHKSFSVDYGNGLYRTFYRHSFPDEIVTGPRNTYFVDPDGSDVAGDGTPARPFQTIMRGYGTARPGDLIYVNAGTYLEHLNIFNGGTPGNPVTISAAPGAIGRVILTVSTSYIRTHPNTDIIHFNSGVQYVHVNGLIIQGILGQAGAAASEHYGADVVSIFAGAQHITLTNNIIHSGLHCGVKGGINNILDGNIIFNNGTSSLDHGVYVAGDGTAGNWTITRNIIFDNAGYGVHCYPTPGNIVITRNVLAWNRQGGIVQGGANGIIQFNIAVNNLTGILYYRGGCVGNLVTNNIFAFNTRHDGDIDHCGGACGSPSGNIDDHNVYFPQRPNARIPPGPEDLYADPHFVNSAGGDFRLTPASPASGGLQNYLPPTVN